MKTSSEFRPFLSVLREQIAASGLLPGPYAPYRRLLADGLHLFLLRLSPVRLRGLIAEQMRLPPAASTAERLVALLRHIPALHKLGQVVARDRRLQSSFRKRLQELESLAPSTREHEPKELLDKAFPGWRRADIQPASRPLAEGSVAIILPFVRRRQPTVAKSLRPGHFGSDPAPHNDGIFKLLKPDIEGLLDEDLEILGRLGDFLDEDCERYCLPELDYKDTFDTIRDLLRHEVRLGEEQRHLAQAARNFTSMPDVIIPALLPFCSPRVTAMTRIAGVKITDFASADAAAKDQLARLAITALVGQPFFSCTPTPSFHADPHAGNLLAAPGGKLGILDWSLVGQLHKRHRVGLAQLVLGALSLSVSQMAFALENLVEQRLDTSSTGEVLNASLREVRWGRFPGLAWVTELLDQLALQLKAKFCGDLLLFRKSLLTLTGVLADVVRDDNLRAEALMNEALLKGFWQEWLDEWPKRFRLPLGAPSSATHISTANLLCVLGSAPFTLTQWWGENVLDWLQLTSSALSSQPHLGADSVRRLRAS